jgi:hypothetical protein
MKNSKKSPKGKKEKSEKNSKGESSKKPSTLAPAKVKGKGKEVKNWKNVIDDEDEFEAPLDDDFKGFDDFYAGEEDEEEDF